VATPGVKLNLIQAVSKGTRDPIQSREAYSDHVLVLEIGNVSQPRTRYQGLSLRDREGELAKPV